MRGIYNTKEWKNLGLDIRTDLIPTIEKVRSGAQIEFWRKINDKNREEQVNYLEYCLEKIGMKYRSYELNHYVSWKEFWLDKLWGRKINHGQFLGYPQCCIDNFEIGCEEYLKGKGPGPMVKFWQDAKKMVQEDKFNENLLYILHAPCSLYCKETMVLVREIKKVLNFNDPEAGKYLRQTNLKNILNIKL